MRKPIYDQHNSMDVAYSRNQPCQLYGNLMVSYMAGPAVKVLYTQCFVHCYCSVYSPEWIRNVVLRYPIHHPWNSHQRGCMLYTKQSIVRTTSKRIKITLSFDRFFSFTRNRVAAFNTRRGWYTCQAIQSKEAHFYWSVCGARSSRTNRGLVRDTHSNKGVHPMYERFRPWRGAYPKNQLLIKPNSRNSLAKLFVLRDSAVKPLVSWNCAVDALTLWGL